MKKYLKALLFLAVLAALTMASVSAMADQPLYVSFGKSVTLSSGQSTKITTKLNTVKDGTVAYSLTDTAKKTVVYSETRTDLAAGQEITWPVPYYDAGLTAQKPTKMLRASFVLDGKTYSYNLYYTLDPKAGTVTVEKGTWYPKNTACSFGPAFRDVRPSLTDKWYTFTPVDLSIQGRQTFEYVASNLYVIGEVYVDVAGDTVMVTYHNYYADQGGNTETLTEFMTFFHDLGSVTDAEPETMQELGYRFGQPISIERDLAGDTNVLLFIRNQVTYCDYVISTHKLIRFWPNLPERKALREKMQMMMD
jgi:hypothetical protein